MEMLLVMHCSAFGVILKKSDVSHPDVARGLLCDPMITHDYGVTVL